MCLLSMLEFDFHDITTANRTIVSIGCLISLYRYRRFLMQAQFINTQISPPTHAVLII